MNLSSYTGSVWRGLWTALTGAHSSKPSQNETHFLGTAEFYANVTHEQRAPEAVQAAVVEPQEQDAPEASEARRGNGMAELLEANA